MDLNKCRKIVYPNDKWGSFHPGQCSRKRWKDGWCKQHHPDNEQVRADARQKAWEEKWANDPRRKLTEALEEIVRLKARIAEMEGK